MEASSSCAGSGRFNCFDLSCMDEPGEEESAASRAEEYLSAAEVEEQKGNYRAASENYRKALMVSPENATAHNNFGYLCSTHTLDYATAENHYRLAIRYSPDFALAHNNLAFFLKKHKRDLVGAEHHYREAIRCDPDYAFAHSNLGVLLKSKRDLVGAEHHYLAAINSNPRYAPAYLNYALLLKPYDEETSYAYLRHAMNIDPTLRDSPVALSLLKTLRKGASYVVLDSEDFAGEEEEGGTADALPQLVHEPRIALLQD